MSERRRPQNGQDEALREGRHQKPVVVVVFRRIALREEPTDVVSTTAGLLVGEHLPSERLVRVADTHGRVDLQRSGLWALALASETAPDEPSLVQPGPGSASRDLFRAESGLRAWRRRGRRRRRRRTEWARRRARREAQAIRRYRTGTAAQRARRSCLARQRRRHGAARGAQRRRERRPSTCSDRSSPPRRWPGSSACRWDKSTCTHALPPIWASSPCPPRMPRAARAQSPAPRRAPATYTASPPVPRPPPPPPPRVELPARGGAL